ncbi:MAG: FHA domain-containing protein [Burkholderiaceae bacterium]
MQSPETTDGPRLVLSSGQLVLRSIPVLKEQTSIGRRPYNDVALDDLTVSGEHALIVQQGSQRILRDLNSRNGTLVNGRPITEVLLANGDQIDIGIYRLKFVADVGDGLLDGAGRAGSVLAVIEMLNGPQAGSQIALQRPITSLGQQTSQVAVVARRRNGFYLTHVEGLSLPLVNGESIGLMAYPLAHNDLIELGGVMMRFRVNL